MSERPPFEGTCPTCGKRRYRTQDDAKRAARLDNSGLRMSAYPCGGYWHIGHMSRAARRARLRRIAKRWAAA